MADDHYRRNCGCHGRFYSGIGWTWDTCADHDSAPVTNATEFTHTPTDEPDPIADIIDRIDEVLQ